MSVALLAQGEMVPGRGTTHRETDSPPGCARLGYARLARPIGQQRFEPLALVTREGTLEVDEVHESGIEADDRGTLHTQPREQLGDPERGQGGRTADREHGLPALFL